MALSRRQLLAGALGSLAPTQAPPPPRRLHLSAHYYPWYGPFGTRDFRWDANDDYRPELGFYMSDTEPVVERHVEVAASHGIDGFTVNWHGTGSWADTVTSGPFLRVLKRHPGFRFDIFYDISIRFGVDAGRPLPDFRRSEVLAALLRDLDHIATTYMGHPAYQRIGGRPVLMMYITRAVPAGLETVVALARRVAWQRHGVGLFFVGDEIWWRPGPRLLRHALACDAVTGYSLADPDPFRPPTTIRPFTERSVALYRELGRRIGARSTVVPTLMLRHDDTLFRSPGTRIFPHVSGTGEGLFYEDARRVFDAMLSLARVVDGGDMAYLYLTSFNEWPERTAVEPSAAMVDRYGLATPGREYLRGLLDARRAFEASALAGDGRPTAPS